MKLAFVSGNREKLPDAVIPLGLLNVMASLPDRHEKRLIDLCFEPDPGAVLREKLEEFRPDLVGLGMRNIQNNDYSGLSDNIDYYQSLLSTIREVCDAPVVIGGAGFSVMPAELMERLRPDYGISGEGEVAFPQLVEALERGEEYPETIGALHYRRDGCVFSVPRSSSFLDMASLAVPDRRLADPRYYERYAIDSIQTKRGCPLTCDYCTYPKIEGRVGRSRSAESVVDEMFLALEQQPSIRHFFIVDSVFNLPRTHAKEVCRELIAREWSVPWTCYANPLGFDREFAELARAAGCAGMEIGSDSGCDEVLDRLRKGFRVEDIRRLHDLCKSVALPDCHTFILGTQGETLDDVKRSLDFIVDLDPFSTVIMIWVDDYEALDPVLRGERSALRAGVEELLGDPKYALPHWSVPALKLNFDRQLFRRLRRSGLHGPLWQHMRNGAQADPPASGETRLVG